jgi:hypothetical protein
MEPFLMLTASLLVFLQQHQKQQAIITTTKQTRTAAPPAAAPAIIGTKSASGIGGPVVVPAKLKGNTDTSSNRTPAEELDDDVVSRRNVIVAWYEELSPL